MKRELQPARLRPTYDAVMYLFVTLAMLGAIVTGVVEICRVLDDGDHNRTMALIRCESEFAALRLGIDSWKGQP